VLPVVARWCSGRALDS